MGRKRKEGRPGKLSALAFKRANKPGRYQDGGGLVLRVTDTGARSWLFRYELRGRERWMGLGSADTRTLAEARDLAREQRKLLADGVDPIDARERAEAAKRLEHARSITFNECAAAYIDAHKAGWRNAKHAAQWRATLDAYAAPTIGALPVADVDTGLVLKVLRPIWNEKPETATRVRGRLAAVLGWATAQGHRTGDNPARWRDHLAKLLPARTKVRRVVHHPALPYADVGAFLVELRKQGGTSARALEFLILTAARSGEVRGARWSELDPAPAPGADPAELRAQTWTVPPERIKAGKLHRVPLSPQAVAVLRRMLPLRDAKRGDWIFPGGKAGKPLSDAAMGAVLDRMGRSAIVPHGFRSTFRDWAAERTNFPRELAEAALAHQVGDETERAYQRGDLLEKRGRLMVAWAAYCDRAPAPAGTVVELQAAVRA
jgi:integrase